MTSIIFLLIKSVLFPNSCKIRNFSSYHKYFKASFNARGIEQVDSFGFWLVYAITSMENIYKTVFQ